MKKFLKKCLASTMALSCLAGVGLANGSLVSAKELGKVIFVGEAKSDCDQRSKLIQAIFGRDLEYFPQLSGADGIIDNLESSSGRKARILNWNLPSQDRYDALIEAYSPADIFVLTYDIVDTHGYDEKVKERLQRKLEYIRNNCKNPDNIVLVGIVSGDTEATNDFNDFNDVKNQLAEELGIRTQNSFVASVSRNLNVTELRDYIVDTVAEMEEPAKEKTEDEEQKTESSCRI